MDRLRELLKRTTEKLTSRRLDLKLGSGGINIAVISWVNELDGVIGSVLQGHIGDGEALRRMVNSRETSKGKKSVKYIRYLQGDVNVFLNGERAVEDSRVVVHNYDRNWGRVTLGVGPGNGLAGVLNPV